MTTQDMFEESRGAWDIQCARCGEWKYRTEFPRDKRKKNGLSSWCKSCRLEDKRERYANNTNGYRDNTRNAQKNKWDNDEAFRETQIQKMRERNRRMRADPEYRKRENKGMLLRRYGLTEEEYDTMLEATDGKCPICEVDLDFREYTKTGESPVVDHCHYCGSDRKGTPIGNSESVRGIVCANCNINPKDQGEFSLRWTIHLLRHESVCDMRTDEERETAASHLDGIQVSLNTP